MDNLPTKEGKGWQIALARLSVFTSSFAPMLAAPVILNKWPETNDEGKEQSENAEKISHALSERGLLEHAIIELEEINFYLYRLHPALRQFAMEYLIPEDQSALWEIHWRAMQYLAAICGHTNTTRGIHGNPLLSVVARLAMPDLLKASTYKRDVDTAILLRKIAFLSALWRLE